MMSRIRNRARRQRRERGAVAVMAAILMTVIFGMAAIAVDLSNGFERGVYAQGQADFAALAGAAKLPATNSEVADAVAESLNDNDATPVTAAGLMDGSDDNGEVYFESASQIRVVSPDIQVDYTAARAFGLQSTLVDAEATVGVFSPTGVMPIYAVSGCDYGNQSITDPAGGHVTDPPIPPLAHDAHTNATTLTDLTPWEVAKDATGVSVLLSGKDFKNATKVGFFRGDDNDPTLVVEQDTFSSPSPMPAGGYTKNGGGGSMSFVIPSAVTAVETAWYVRVYEAGTVNKWSARDEAQPLRVGEAVLECDAGSIGGNFGTLKLPRKNPDPDSTWIPVNIADGLEDPLSLAIHGTPAGDGKCTGGSNGAIVSTKHELKPSTNCVDTDTGLPANAATAGLIAGSSGYTGRLIASSSSTSEGGGCAQGGGTSARTVSVSPHSYQINNDVLTCFLMDGSTSLYEIAKPGYSGGPVLSTDIYSSPRFFWQPVLAFDPANGGSGYYSIVDFRPAFITDEVVSPATIRGTNTATAENGLKIESNAVKQMKVVFFNANALSADVSGVPLTGYLGVGPKVLRLID